MKRNIFVPALEDAQRAELETVRNAENYAFHGLLEVEDLIAPKDLHFEELLNRARQELKESSGSVDAIIAHWDFPTSVMVPILCKEHGIPSPSLESVVACEHKYWSRLEQQKSIPEHTPRFSCFDPFAEDALQQIDVDYPFWIKPVKSYASQLGFMIETAEAFHEALEKIRGEIHEIGDAFDEALAHVDLPEEIRKFNGSACIAEEIISGVQAAPEGSVVEGQVRVHGLFDMHKDKAGKSFDRLQYPCALPQAVQDQMIEATTRFLQHIGFDNGCFNAEFMWDEARQKLWMVEVNTRISQSHSEMFILVDGMSNHEIAIDVALGVRPTLSHRKGRYKVAAKCMIPRYEDGYVRRVPGEEEIEKVKAKYPGTDVRIEVEPGMRLRDLLNQDSYRYSLGTIYLGANSNDELLQRYDDCLEILRFEIDSVREDSLTS